MSDYKRLKEKLETILTLPELPFEEDLTAVDCKQMYDILCKIEQGTMIELPCKIKDWLYYIHENAIHKAKVEEIQYSVNSHVKDSESIDIYAYDFKSKRELRFDYEHKFSTIWENNEHYFPDTFLTKAEAEQKLKELKGEV